MFSVLSSVGSTTKPLSKEDDDDDSTISIVVATVGASKGSTSNNNADHIIATASTAASARQQHYDRTDVGLPSVHTQFKGTVKLRNKHWGAQIYANNRRVWLGTFNSERAAAMAYDSAAIKFLGALNPHRNFPWTETNIREPTFQDQFTTEAILDMIKDGSYEEKFLEFLSADRCSLSRRSAAAKGNVVDIIGNVSDHGMVEMFRKMLMPSDVGMLNRLVIPKKDAMTYLRPVPSDHEEGLLLQFRDRDGRVWEFKYCFWKSSKTFVFTRGWKKFVREKGLKADDVVVFYKLVGRVEGRRNLFMVDVMRSWNSMGAAGDQEGIGGQLSLRGEGKIGSNEEELEWGLAADSIQEEERRKRVKLFGVWVC